MPLQLNKPSSRVNACRFNSSATLLNHSRLQSPFLLHSMSHLSQSMRAAHICHSCNESSSECSSMRAASTAVPPCSTTPVQIMLFLLHSSIILQKNLRPKDLYHLLWTYLCLQPPNHLQPPKYSQPPNHLQPPDDLQPPNHMQPPNCSQPPDHLQTPVHFTVATT